MREREPLAGELTEQHLARIRRSRLSGWWLRNRAIIAAVVALMAILLGLWGFAEAAETSKNDFGGWADRVYHTFRLFAFSGDVQQPVPWQLQVARVLAPLVVGYAALQALIALFYQQALLMRLRVFARRHVIVAGLGKRGFMLATALHEAQVQVVVVERYGANPSLSGCRERGIPVIVGDATDKEVLSRARCDRARHVVACCADDATNLDVLAACSALARDSGWAPATAHVLIETLPLCVRLQAAGIGVGSDGALRVDFSSVSELAAKALVGASIDVWRWKTAESCTILVAASTEIGRRLVTHAVRNALSATRDVQVVLIGPDADEDGKALDRAAPWLKRVVTLAVEQFDPCNEDADLPVRIAKADIAFVCHSDDSIALAQGMALADLLPGPVPVIVNVDDDELRESLRATGFELGTVIPLGSAKRVLGPDLLLSTVTEALARARHEAYIRLEHAQGRDSAENPALVPWDELPESLKESNRRFADSVGAKVKELGGRIVPLQPSEVGVESLTLAPHLIDELARQEHKRWANDLVADGWKPTDGPKDPHRKLHPLIVPWEELSAHEREKDRNSIMSLPAQLATTGYKIHFAKPTVQSAAGAYAQSA